jgi:YVTN family beta-propeller protein
MNQQKGGLSSSVGSATRAIPAYRRSTVHGPLILALVAVIVVGFTLVAPSTGNLTKSSTPGGFLPALQTAPAVIATIPVGLNPTAVAYVPPSSTVAYGEILAILPSVNSLAVIDDATNAVVNTISLPVTSGCTLSSMNPLAVAYDSGVGEVFVTSAPCSTVSGDVVALSASTLSLVATISVATHSTDPLALAYDSGLGEIFVVNAALNVAGVVSVISDHGATANTVVATIPFSSTTNELGGVAYDPAKSEVFVGSASDVYVVSDATNAVVSTIVVGAAAMAYDPTQSEMFAANYATGSVAVISDATNTVTATISVGTGPTGAVFDAATGQVLIANYISGSSPGSVSVITAATKVVSFTVSVGDGAQGIAFDPGTGDAYTVNWGSGTVSVVGTPPLTLVPDSGITGTSTTLTGYGYAASQTYNYCFESGTMSSPTTCGTTNQFTATTSGYIPASTTLTVSGSTGLVVVSDGSTTSVTSDAAFTVLSTTTTSVSCLSSTPAPTTTCWGNVTGESDNIVGESITWSQSSGSGVVGFNPDTCTIVSGTPDDGCSTIVTGTTAGSASVQASYSGDSGDAGSSASQSLTVTVPSVTSTVVSCGSYSLSVSTTCTATVTGEVTSITGETISWAQIPSAVGPVSIFSGSPATPLTCTLSGTPESCSMLVAALVTGTYPVQLSASYPGDASNTASTSAYVTLTWAVSAVTTTTISCQSYSPSPSTTCNAFVKGVSGTITGEPVVWSQTGGTGTVSFSSPVCTLSASPFQCVAPVTVTAGSSGTVTIQAWYPGSVIVPNSASIGTQTMTIANVAISPTMGPDGATITPAVFGLSPSTGYEVCFDTAQGVASTYCASFVTNGAGGYSTPFSVPTGLPASTTPYYVDVFEVSVTAATYISSASSQFTATSPSITVLPSQGPVGAAVTVSGTGFSVSATLSSLTFDGVSISGCDSPGSFSTGSTGSFSCPITVPVGTSGTTVAAIDAGGTVATGSFTVTSPAISVTPGEGPVGSMVQVDGTGFSVSSILSSLVFDGVPVSSCLSGDLMTGDTGIFSCQFAVPVGTTGTIVTATDAGGASAPGTFSVTTLGLTVTPGQGPVGASVTVGGTGFSAGTSVALLFDGVATSFCNIDGTLLVGSTGVFTCTLSVPSGTSGTSVVATDGVGPSAEGTFTVTAMQIVISPGSGPENATVTVFGTGFSVLSSVGLVFAGVTISTCSIGGGLTTLSTGEFSCVLDVPGGTSGTTVTVTDSGGQTASGTFVVSTPSITVSPLRGPIGASVTVLGTGFFAWQQLKSLVFDNVVIRSCTSGNLLTNETGAFSCGFPVPSGTAGTTVTVTDISGLYALGTFTVTKPKITLHPATSGGVGEPVTVSGTGFSVSSLVKLNFDGVEVSTSMCGKTSLHTGANGAFSCTLDVPAGTTSTTVTVTDVGGQVATAKFTVS